MPFVILTTLFVLTAILTAAEMATFSARVERMKQADEAGDRRGIMVLAYQRSPMHFLAALQLLTTGAAFWAGSIMEVSLTAPFEIRLLSLGVSPNWAPSIATISVLTVMTMISLVFTNVLPKQIGFIRANEIALKAATPMLWVIRITRPLGWIVTSSVGAWLRARHVSPDEKHRVTERDIRSLVKEGTTRGGLDRREQIIVNRALDLSDIPATDVMTPIQRVDAIDLKRGLEQAEKVVHSSGHSYLPVIDGSFSNLLGTLRTRDWLVHDDRSLRTLRRLPAPPVYVSQRDSLLQVLEALRPVETRSVFVRDHSGTVVGMITLNDAVARILGPMKPLET